MYLHRNQSYWFNFVVWHQNAGCRLALAVVYQRVYWTELVQSGSSICIRTQQQKKCLPRKCQVFLHLCVSLWVSNLRWLPDDWHQRSFDSLLGFVTKCLTNNPYIGLFGVVFVFVASQYQWHAGLLTSWGNVHANSSGQFQKGFLSWEFNWSIALQKQNLFVCYHHSH